MEDWNWEYCHLYGTRLQQYYCSTRVEVADGQSLLRCELVVDLAKVIVAAKRTGNCALPLVGAHDGCRNHRGNDLHRRWIEQVLRNHVGCEGRLVSCGVVTERIFQRRS